MGRGGTNKGKLFGRATYLTPTFSKADTYTGGTQVSPRSGARRILVVRAALGKVYETKQTMTNCEFPPYECDSVFAVPLSRGGVVDHPEVMVYDCNQTLPMYL